MDVVWIPSLHDLHCPRCDSRLVQKASRHFHAALGVPVYVGDVETLTCPERHRLPEPEVLYAYRTERRRTPRAPASEVGRLTD